MSWQRCENEIRKNGGGISHWVLSQFCLVVAKILLSSVAKRPGKFSSFEQFLGFGGAGGF
jgi:hypothetical protein